MDNGLDFLHEHPAITRRWQDNYVQRILNYWRVYKVEIDMCRVNMKQ